MELEALQGALQKARNANREELLIHVLRLASAAIDERRYDVAKEALDTFAPKERVPAAVSNALDASRREVGFLEKLERDMRAALTQLDAEPAEEADGPASAARRTAAGKGLCVLEGE